MDFATVLQNWPLEAVAALLAGVVVLLAPRILSYTLAAYLLVVGTLGLLHVLHGRPVQPQAVLAVVAGLLILIRPAVLHYVVGIYLIAIGLLDSGILRL
jgi:uncharacterized membrane protein HdeD (DUF308 family)